MHSSILDGVEIGIMSTLENFEQQNQILLPGGAASLGKDGIKAEEKGIMITPVPGFTLKTRNLANNQKIFINICTHNDIDIPGIKKKLNDKGIC